MTLTAHDAPPLGARVARARRYPMCRPEHFEVPHAINPWMDPRTDVDTRVPVDQRPDADARWLVDPRSYHRDTAPFALDDQNIAHLPAAFSAGSRAVLETLFPDAVRATEADALVLGLNAVSDGRHVVLAPEAEQVADRGHVPVHLSELRTAGGGARCATMELRGARS